MSAIFLYVLPGPDRSANCAGAGCGELLAGVKSALRNENEV